MEMIRTRLRLLLAKHNIHIEEQQYTLDNDLNLKFMSVSSPNTLFVNLHP